MIWASNPCLGVRKRSTKLSADLCETSINHMVHSSCQSTLQLNQLAVSCFLSTPRPLQVWTAASHRGSISLKQATHLVAKETVLTTQVGLGNAVGSFAYKSASLFGSLMKNSEFILHLGNLGVEIIWILMLNGNLVKTSRVLER